MKEKNVHLHLMFSVVIFFIVVFFKLPLMSLSGEVSVCSLEKYSFKKDFKGKKQTNRLRSEKGKGMFSNKKLLNLNKATLIELCSLPGVGAKLAKRIIIFRKLYGFRNIEDLKKVKGIGEKKFNKIKNLIFIINPTLNFKK